MVRLGRIVAGLLAFAVLCELDSIVDFARDPTVAAWALTREGWSEVLYPLRQFRFAVKEPPGFDQRLSAALQVPLLSPEQIRSYDREGRLIIRGIVRDQQVLRMLADGLAPHQQFHQADYVRPWHYNGFVRALLRQGHFDQLARQLMHIPENEPVNLWETPIWGAKPNAHFPLPGSWHQDAPLSVNFTTVTLWLAVTEAPHSLDLALGSHLARKNLSLLCNRSYQMGKPGERLLNSTCVHKFVSALGVGGVSSTDLFAGDLVAFNGDLAHRGMRWPRFRTAISMRWMDYNKSKDDKDLLKFEPGGEDPFKHERKVRLVPRPEDSMPLLEQRLPKWLLPPLLWVYNLVGPVVVSLLGENEA